MTRAQEIHRRAIVIDGHSDILIPVTDGKMSLADRVAVPETALDVMGPDHIGLGSDYYGFEFAPEGLEDISAVPRLTDALVARGHSDEVILKFLGENYLRVFETVWGS